MEGGPALEGSFRLDLTEKMFALKFFHEYFCQRLGIEIDFDVQGFIEKNYCSVHVLDEPSNIESLPECLREAKVRENFFRELRHSVLVASSYIESNLDACLFWAVVRLEQEACIGHSYLLSKENSSSMDFPIRASDLEEIAKREMLMAKRRLGVKGRGGSMADYDLSSLYDHYNSVLPVIKKAKRIQRANRNLITTVVDRQRGCD